MMLVLKINWYYIHLSNTMNTNLLIDNYDSFTYNLYHMIPNCDVIRNDELSLEEIKSRNYKRIIIGPGPGSPDQEAYFGVCSSVITELGKSIPVLGICLGMQGIAHIFGGNVIKAKNIMHGKISTVITEGKPHLFKDIPSKFDVMRYHSLVVADIPDSLEITSYSADDKEVMSLRHKEFPIYGMQFHPESFGTEFGKKIIDNFLK